MHHIMLAFLFLAVPLFNPSESPGQAKIEYVCPPCGCDGDEKSLDKPGNCPECGMEMVDKASTLSLSAIPAFRKISDSVWIAGQPTIAQLGLLKAEGVRTIINLRMHTEHDYASEEAKAKEMGITYINLPMDFDAPKAAYADSFLRATDEYLPKGRTFIHCAAAIRAGALWMIRRVERDGWEYGKAREEARQGGLRRDGGWVEFAKDYVRARHPEN